MESSVLSTCKCVLCDAVFPTKSDLQDHFRSHGKSDVPPPVKPAENVANFTPPTTCELCGFSCTNIRSYWQHYRKFHPEWRGLDCSHCGKHFLQKSDYDRHIVTHANEPSADSSATTNAPVIELYCETCNAKFFSTEALRTHAQGHEQVQQLQSIVNEERKKGVKRPKMVPGAFKLKASYCKLCLWQFGNSTALAQHLVTHSIFLCLICGKELNTDEMFRNHQKVHLPATSVLNETMAPHGGGPAKRGRRRRCVL